MINIKSEREIELMRKTCKLAANTLKMVGQKVRVGMSTEEINKIVHDYIIAHEAYPSPLNYHGFPKSVCTSINDVICHGIPSEKDLLQNGDIVNIDVTTYLNKFHGDTNATFFVGEVKDEVRKLVDVTHLCLMEGIKVVRPGARIGDIGAVIAEIAHGYGYSVVKDYCGHGIGREFHEEPQVVHISKKNTGPEMKPGMTFTIEPMINMGKAETKLLADGWTVKTKDGSLSAQFEHTILVTKDGHEILTIAD